MNARSARWREWGLLSADPSLPRWEVRGNGKFRLRFEAGDPLAQGRRAAALFSVTAFGMFAATSPKRTTRLT
jgi:hypothetical protein